MPPKRKASCSCHRFVPEEKKLQIMVGSILAGNDAPELIRDVTRLALSLRARGKITQQEMSYISQVIRSTSS